MPAKSAKARPAVARPAPYQKTALKNIRKALTSANRATVVMACGTGKTLVSLWATQEARPKRVLVLVPSLTLLQQTLSEWNKHHTFTPGFRYLCVCSDKTVGLKDDEIEFRQEDLKDLGFRVDTDPKEVKRFLTDRNKDVKVVFATYHSARVVGAGAAGYTFDMGIFDEAHKTTGREGAAFTYALSDAHIRIRKRLFFTATPRIIDIRHRDKNGDLPVQSMDDPQVYGIRAHTLSFASAVKQQIICPYKVVTSCIDKQMVSDFARKHGITLVETDPVQAHTVARLLAFQQAVKKTGATKAITFHSRVKAAQEFASDPTHGIGRYLNGYDVFHVFGKQKSSERKKLIEEFRAADKGVMTNARCLTEGVDVPAVDMVAFLDPKQSRIDIAQAIGRAMRKPRGTTTKTVGYVVVPLFAADFTQNSLDEAVQFERFEEVADVLNALQAHDEDLVGIIREIRQSKGAGKQCNVSQLSQKVEVIGPAVDLERLQASISVAIADSIGSSWDERYGRLVAYKERKGNCDVPQEHIENGYVLGDWVSVQRAKKAQNKLSPEQVQRLTKLGFVWDALAANWGKGYWLLVRFHKREGHCLVPAAHPEEEFPLGQWVSAQRWSKTHNKLSSERFQRLTKLGFVWDVLDDQWEKNFHYLKIFQKREGHCLVPIAHTEEGFTLGRWVSKQRVKKVHNKLSPEQVQRLTKLGFAWKGRKDKRP